MGIFSPGFTGRRREHVPDLPPGQYLERGFPVLTTGPTPHIDRRDWQLTLTTETGERRSWNWQQMLDLGPEEISTDIHCVTAWSKLGTTWRGVPLDRFLDGVETHAQYVMAGCYGGYTTNIPLQESLGRAWVAFEYDGRDLEPEHGGPARLLVPHLYFWKSAKWVNSLRLMREDSPGFWEQNGYSMHGDPWREERYW
ncbi:molybdopterin-dependent oxidoreductase [Naasia sp. SYSU D00948]|uniref:molybdopterin-dependent oxidoreductase n=1 Tax=Naasia sp. SYSU D00948 TaxID=2817379 RepID=UPI001B3087E7|nr:molybdopterin-dependent oxidoreductase [Naasia sp. SYSU D00948]